MVGKALVEEEATEVSVETEATEEEEAPELVGVTTTLVVAV